MTFLRYPRLLALGASIALGISFFFWEQETPIVHSFFQTHRYAASFVAGILLVYGLTAAPATAVLVNIGVEPGSLIVCWLLATSGAVLGDYVIFRYVRFGLTEEITRLRKWRIWLFLPHWHTRLPAQIRLAARLAIAGFLIASPLPDEFGVSLLATTQRVSTRMFVIVATLLDAAGIYAILWLSNRFLT